ncbi:hypothetical protein ACFOWZ_12895 [Lentzea rhizosphaerae]|uniref:Uncharacterized protein n=1 Tax=Lentzea rhizosphaerae TaxID=2041025 RepID=A0ABV8BSQ2_9PSEU
MRKIVVVLVGCLVLSGCGAAEWHEKVRFKVDKIYEVAPKYDRKYAKLRLELVGEAPDDALEPDTVSPQVVDRFQITSVIKTDLSWCEKA